MNTIFINSKNSKISKPRVSVLNLTDLRRSEKYVALLNLSIYYYTWKNIKKSYNNNKFKISMPVSCIRYARIFQIYFKRAWRK